MIITDRKTRLSAGDDAGRNRVARLGVGAAEALEHLATAALEGAGAGAVAGIEADLVGLGRRLLDALAAAAKASDDVAHASARDKKGYCISASFGAQKR